MTHHPFPTPAIAAALAPDRMRSAPAHRVVVVGGGFGGLPAARALRRAPVGVTLVDRATPPLPAAPLPGRHRRR